MNFENKQIIGMIHCGGQVEDSIKEIAILEEEGVDAIIVENYHGYSIEVTNVLKELKNHEFKIQIGINILPNEFNEAFQLASTYGATFIQLDHIAGIYKNDTTLNLLEYEMVRKKYPDITVLGGVWPKYYRPVDSSDLDTDIKDGMKRADAIVVTGEGTGKETPLDKIKKFKSIVDEFPLIIGAGLDPSNVVKQLVYADGAIVGSCFKPYGRTQELIKRELVREFMDEVNKVR
jgi:membrane complex biogenesis BtpA family protein